MNSYLIPYKTTIQKANPLEESNFNYNTKLWSKLNPEAKAIVKHFSNKKLNRNDIIQAFKEYFEGLQEYRYPFVLTMIWGFADTGYGTYRTNKYLSTAENKNRIETAFQDLKKGNRESAFKTLMKIKGLSISYVSKLFYFATRALDTDYALIFDIRVARALVKICNPAIESLLQINPSKKYEDYQSYNKLIHCWAKELNVEAENMEYFLFNYQ